MNIALKLIIPAVAAAASLACVPTALAASANTPAVVRTAPATASSNPWKYWATYGTDKACSTEGRHLWDIGSVVYWQCEKYNAGDYFDYELFVILGHNPGS